MMTTRLLHVSIISVKRFSCPLLLIMTPNHLAMIFTDHEATGHSWKIQRLYQQSDHGLNPSVSITGSVTLKKFFLRLDLLTWKMVQRIPTLPAFLRKSM